MTDEGDDRRAEMSCTKGKNRTEDARVPMGLIAKRAAAEVLRLGLFVSLGIGLTGCLDLPVPAADRQQLLSADLASDRKAERRTPARRRLAVLVKTPEQKEPDKATGPFSLEKLEALARQHNPTAKRARRYRQDSGPIRFSATTVTTSGSRGRRGRCKPGSFSRRS